MSRSFSTDVPFAPAINTAYRESWHGVESPSFCGRFNCPSTILIMPSLSHDPTAIKVPIISGRSRARLAVRSKPVRLNIRSGSADISV
jgi:hypothetical protein